jgi:hypothetical protein
VKSRYSGLPSRYAGAISKHRCAVDLFGYIAWMLVCAALGAWYARRQNRDRLDAAEMGATYILIGAIVGALFAVAVLLLGWLIG